MLEVKGSSTEGAVVELLLAEKETRGSKYYQVFHNLCACTSNTSWKSLNLHHEHLWTISMDSKLQLCVNDMSMCAEPLEYVDFITVMHASQIPVAWIQGLSGCTVICGYPVSGTMVRDVRLTHNLGASFLLTSRGYRRVWEGTILDTCWTEQ